MKSQKNKLINFQPGDLVEINFNYVKGVIPYDNLYIVLSVEKNDVGFMEAAFNYTEQTYVDLLVREVTTGRELKSLVCISKGEDHCEFIHVK